GLAKGGPRPLRTSQAALCRSSRESGPTLGRVAKLRHFLPLADLLGRQGVESRPAREPPRPQEREISMKSTDLAQSFLAQASRSLLQVYLPRLEACMRELSPEQIWWRANPASNSVGNLALHMAGNVRQWIVAGLGGAPDRRER